MTACVVGVERERVDETFLFEVVVRLAWCKWMCNESSSVWWFWFVCCVVFGWWVSGVGNWKCRAITVCGLNFK